MKRKIDKGMNEKMNVIRKKDWLTEKDSNKKIKQLKYDNDNKFKQPIIEYITTGRDNAGTQERTIRGRKKGHKRG